MAAFELDAPDFGGFGAILMEAEALKDGLRDTAMNCPRCGYALDENSRGQVSCPLGHYRADKRPNLLEDG